MRLAGHCSLLGSVNVEQIDIVIDERVELLRRKFFLGDWLTSGFGVKVAAESPDPCDAAQQLIEVRESMYVGFEFFCYDKHLDRANFLSTTIEEWG